MPHAITHDEMISAEESLIADVQVVIHNLMEDSNVSRADLARALGVSDARVSQMFSDHAPNLTLRTIARVFRVLGDECRFTSERWEAILVRSTEPFDATETTEDDSVKAPTRRKNIDLVALLDLVSAFEGNSVR